MIERPRAARQLGVFASFRFRDFRLLWTGLLISNLGTWMQLTAIGYAIATLAHTPAVASLYLGIQGAARAVPVLIASPLAGLIADRFPRRRTLFFTNSTMALLALILAVLATFGKLTIGNLILLSTLNSIAMSFDSPTRQSWVPLMVDREYVGNAIGLNSVAFNSPAVVGPAVAGWMIAAFGVSGAFYLNAVATLAVVVALIFMKPSPASGAVREPLLGSITQGVRFLLRHKILSSVIGVFLVTAIFVRPYSSLLPAFAVNVLHSGARGLGVAYAAVGVGGFAGALLTAYFGTRERRGAIWLFSAAVMSLGVVALGFVPKLWIALPVLFVIGTAALTFLGASNTLIQTLSPTAVRGRAVSVYTMIALGVVPGGALMVGGIGSLIGLHRSFMIGGVISLLCVLWVWRARPIVRTV